ncbi:unnamed protein product [Ilex paraguariensis]|uniref:Myb-like domain-containing protein n=1 Tax=Ilex paraguariensis TaxID=185542 RepID=A0ABC8TR51_9AQUA
MEEAQFTNGLEYLQTSTKEEDIDCEMEKNDRSHHQSRVLGSRRTRSQVAPDWTVQESLILVNEINATERDCRNTLSSFQKWQIIAENCKALEVHRSMNQCKRKWDSLLAEYERIKQLESEAGPGSYWSLDGHKRRELGLADNFDTYLFKVIDDSIKGKEGRPDTDPEMDPEAEADVPEVIAETAVFASNFCFSILAGLPWQWLLSRGFDIANVVILQTKHKR